MGLYKGFRCIINLIRKRKEEIMNFLTTPQMNLRNPANLPRTLPSLSPKQSSTKQNRFYQDSFSPIRLNARKKHCRQIWTSYGITMISLPFLGDLGQVVLQKLNKFFYNIAICRVQVSIITDSTYCYLTDSYKNGIMSY